MVLCHPGQSRSASMYSTNPGKGHFDCSGISAWATGVGLHTSPAVLLAQRLGQGWSSRKTDKVSGRAPPIILQLTGCSA